MLLCASSIERINFKEGLHVVNVLNTYFDVVIARISGYGALSNNNVGFCMSMLL